MTEYICKYTPVELLSGFGATCVLYNLSAEQFSQADRVMHRNVCAFSRALLEHRLEAGDTPLILTNCCDSIRRTGDVLSGRGQDVFTIDLPHSNGRSARRFYQKELLRLMETYEAFSHQAFDCEKFRAACGEEKKRPAGHYILLLGARMSEDLLEHITSASPLPVLNGMCTGNRTVEKAPQGNDRKRLMAWYAEELLSQPPCMRMTDIKAREKQIEDRDLAGIIYNTVSFCDYYSFEYGKAEKKRSVPILKLETDYTVQSAAQLKNRLDAFFETLRLPRKKECFAGAPIQEKNRGQQYFAGVDSGSTSTNAVILDRGKRIVSYAVAPTGVNVEKSAREAFAFALQKAGISEKQVLRTISTGYGRAGIAFRSRDVTEITCHAKGAVFLNPKVRTVIDIGGQDSKIIRLNADGTVKDFSMNDKCAAGTGRFLEMMAQSLGIGLEEMSTRGLRWDEKVVISSMCSVFAQSEVVSLIAAGKKLPDIVHGLNDSVAAKVLTLGGRSKMEGSFMMTGGVARNLGVVRAVEEKLGRPVLRPDAPEICGALGAALLAREDGAE